MGYFFAHFGDYLANSYALAFRNETFYWWSYFFTTLYVARSKRSTILTAFQPLSIFSNILYPYNFLILKKIEI